MSQQTLRQFVDKHLPSAAALCALTARLEARATGTPLKPALDGASQQLLGLLGGGEVLDDVTAGDARMLLSEVRHFVAGYAKLLYPLSRSGSWSFDDPDFLQDAGDFARRHGMALDKMIIPALPGLPERMAAPDASLLDVGVGAAGLAIQFAENRPNARVVGIDVFQPALRLARENVKKAGVESRVELREQGFETLEEKDTYDLAWVPLPFIPERHIAPGLERVARSLKPGGWVVLAYLDTTGHDPVVAAQYALIQAVFGGPKVTSTEVEKLCRDKGLVDVQKPPGPPGIPAALTVARKRP